jgi:hypothetical protein
MSSARSSGLQTADAIVASGRSRVNTVTLISDGTNACNVVIYDALSATGTVLAKLSIGAASLKATEQVVFQAPLITEVGIFADVTGTGAAYIVTYGGS